MACARRMEVDENKLLNNEMYFQGLAVGHWEGRLEVIVEIRRLLHEMQSRAATASEDKRHELSLTQFDVDEEVKDLLELFPIFPSEIVTFPARRGWSWEALFAMFPEQAVLLYQRQRERIVNLRSRFLTATEGGGGKE